MNTEHPCAIDETPGDAQGTSRREIIKLAAAALVGAGVSLVSPSAAFATTGNMQFGAGNNAGTAETSLTSATGFNTLNVVATGANGTALYVQNSAASTGPAVAVFHGGAGTSVYAENTSTGAGGLAHGVMGEINNASNGSAGVYGKTNGIGQAVLGESSSTTPNARGVIGRLTSASATGCAIEGVASGASATGVWANGSGGAVGLKVTTTGTARAAYVEVNNAANSAEALYVTTNGPGTAIKAAVTNTGTSASALSGTTAGTGYAVRGENTLASSIQPAVIGIHDGVGPGVYGRSANGTGYGLAAESPYTAQLWLAPGMGTGAPISGAHAMGEIRVDGDGTIYRIIAAGSPGTWVPMRSTVMLPSPVRVIDTRNGKGGVAGPMNTMTWYTFNVLAAAGVPAQAVALVGNLTMVAPSGTKLLDGKGWMAILPATHATGSAASDPGVSTVNAGSNTYATANQFTVGLGAGAYAGNMSLVFSSAQHLHAIVDIAGYIA